MTSVEAIALRLGLDADELDPTVLEYCVNLARTDSVEVGCSAFEMYFPDVPEVEIEGVLRLLIANEESSPEHDEEEEEEVEDRSATTTVEEGDDAEDESLEILLHIFPQLVVEDAAFVLHHVCHDSVEDSVQRCLHADFLCGVRRARLEWQRAQDEKEQLKRAIVDQWADEIVTSGTSDKKTKKKEKNAPPKKSGAPAIRYLDGKVVSTKGEKSIIVDEKPEWDGGSRGRVKTKGKRGKGWA